MAGVQAVSAGGSGGRGQDLTRAAGELAPLLPELAPGLSYMAETFSRAFVARVIQRMVGGSSALSAPREWRRKIERDRECASARYSTLYEACVCVCVSMCV